MLFAIEIAYLTIHYRFSISCKTVEAYMRPTFRRAYEPTRHGVFNWDFNHLLVIIWIVK
jgi:hypothetical protein